MSHLFPGISLPLLRPWALQHYFSCETNEKQFARSCGTEKHFVLCKANEMQCGTAEKQQPKEQHSVSCEVNEKQQQQARQRKHKHTAPKQHQHQLQQQHIGDLPDKECSGQLILRDLISNSYNRSNSIFFIETSNKTTLTSREACALESAARWDPWTK
jgi:hypothetical protein